MGTFYEVTFAPPSDEVDPASLQQLIDELLAAINKEMSTYDPTSEISKFNESQDTEWFEVSPRFAQVVYHSLQICELTEGAFDPTVGPLVDLWHFGSKIEDRTIPTEEQIQATLENCGYQSLEVRADPPALRKTKPGLRLDLSAVAKGFAVDEVSRLLSAQGLKNHLVNIGGEIVARGWRGPDQRWRLAIEKPRQERETIQLKIEVTSTAMATSGNYRNFYEIDGVRYAHTINPATGYPVQHELLSATVLTEDCMTADALATAMMVMGTERAEAFLYEHLLAGYLISERDGELQTSASPIFAELAGEQ